MFQIFFDPLSHRMHQYLFLLHYLTFLIRLFCITSRVMILSV